MTTLVNIVTYYLFVTLLHVDYKVATTIAWIVSVLFAYITNKKYVFNSSHSTLGQVFKEFFYFMGFRLLSYFIDIFSMILLVGVMHINDLFAKIVANVIVVVFNYFASKYVIFKKNVEPGKKSHIS